MTGLANKQVVPVVQSVGSLQFAVRLAVGTTQLLPAPPAGFFTMIETLRLTNEHATVTADLTMSDSAGLVAAWQGTAVIAARGVAAAPAVASSVNVVVFVPFISLSAINVTVNTGGPVVLLGVYRLLPIGRISETVLVLTSAYQTLAVPSPPAGFMNVVLNQIADWQVLGLPAQPGYVMNNDTATANVVFRLTRSAQTYEWITQAATRQRAELSSPLFVLHAGDVLEAMAAHTVALSQTLRVYYNAVPVQVP